MTVSGDKHGERLLPCPFCGGIASRSVGKKANGEDWHYIECTSCSACAEIDGWNRRAPLSAIGTSPRWFIETIAGPAFTRDELRAEAKAMLERPTAPPASAVSHDATSEVHSCSYYCGRPECVKAQRDELRDRLERSATVTSEYICKCGIRVIPHRCGDSTEF